MSTDIVDPATRSRMMAGIRAKNTRPEMIVRRGLHAQGFRFVLHDRRLTGKPDLVLPRWRAVVFVQGCFWHGHNCRLFKWPKTREAFWRQKIDRNRTRDAEVEERLYGDGWRVLRIWECAIKGPDKIGADVALSLATAWLRSDDVTGQIRGTTRAGG